MIKKTRVSSGDSSFIAAYHKAEGYPLFALSFFYKQLFEHKTMTLLIPIDIQVRMDASNLN